MEKEITIQKLFQEALKRWWLILICVVVCGAIFYAYSTYFISDMYTSKAIIYVDNKAPVEIIPEGQQENNTANLLELTTAEMLVDTYIEILNSNGFYKLIEKNEDIPYSAGQMRGMVTYSRVEETGVIYIDVTAPTPEDANLICSSILKYANVQIMNIMGVGSVKVIDEASMPTSPSYPNVMKNTIFGMIIGILLAAVIIFFINFFDVHIKTVEDIENKYDLVVLGTIPNMFTNKSSNGGDGYEQ